MKAIRIHHRIQFEAMNVALGAHGGFAGSAAIVQRLRCHIDQPLRLLARWIVSRSVIHVTWQDQMLVPMFQFDLADMSIKPSCTRVIGELASVYDDWELACWFVAPNAWLEHAAPVARLANDAFAVLQAARADRYIAQG